MKMRAEELVGRMSQLVEPTEDWHIVGAQDEPVFASGISNTGSPNETAAFRKCGKRVYIRGRIQHSSNLNAATVFTLPYAPNQAIHKACTYLSGSTWVGGLAYIGTDGALMIYGTGTFTIATINIEFYLDN